MRRHRSQDLLDNVVARNELAGLAEDLRKSGKKIVTTNGCFDILHVGHTRILKQARALGDVLVVGINSDDSVRRLKGPTRPINSQDDRAEVLASLACVDYVTIFDEDTPVEFLKEIKPDIHVKGSDYSPEKLEETPVVESFGGKVHILALVPGKSTSGVVDRIAGGQP
ncbi:MAG: D-glycero-beta-D-manno-heptose 1-phosphate adenylyltransferase [Cyanobacteria bacterium HKST-UBA02]|nr:D-glycero-beta-D-manno-heptose 1-phosphate adenylyltransferase [Cyanobacteria bacterium HKST-UBA02]